MKSEKTPRMAPAFSDPAETDGRRGGAVDAPQRQVREPAEAPEPEDAVVPEETREHAPGEVQAAPVADLWSEGSADSLRERWRELQLLFVDDPQSAAAQADQLVGEAIDALTSSLQEQRAELAQWRTARDADTEGLRVAVQRYHRFLDTVLAM